MKESKIEKLAFQLATKVFDIVPTAMKKDYSVKSIFDQLLRSATSIWANLAEAHYDGQLAKIAEDISNSNNPIKIILIAGPSSAGKTTSSK